MERTNRGITLIALIITIIIMLILAGIVLSLTLGEHGIINRVNSASQTYEIAQIKEELEVEIINIQSEKLTQGKEKTRQDLLELSNIGASMETIAIPSIGEYKDYLFEVDEFYHVKIIKKVEGEKPELNLEVITPIVEEGGIVQIKAVGSIQQGSIQSIQALNGGELSTDVSSSEKIFNVTKNGIYYFSVKADNGRVTVKTIEVNSIKEKPEIVISNVTKDGFTIEVVNNYKEGLVTQYKYYVGGTVKSQGTTSRKYVVTGLAFGTEYNIYVEAYFGTEKLPSDTATITTESVNLADLKPGDYVKYNSGTKRSNKL